MTNPAGARSLWTIFTVAAALCGNPVHGQDRDQSAAPRPVRELAGCYDLTVLRADSLSALKAPSPGGRFPSQIRLRTERDPRYPFPVPGFYRVDERRSAAMPWRPSAAAWTAGTGTCAALHLHCTTTAWVLWSRGEQPGPAIALWTHARDPHHYRSPTAPELTGRLVYPSEGADAPDRFVIARVIPCEGADQT